MEGAEEVSMGTRFERTRILALLEEDVISVAEAGLIGGGGSDPAGNVLFI